MALSELYTKYNRVWIPDPEEVWQSAEILKDYKSGDDVLELQLENGTEMRYPVETGNVQLPHLRNPDILVGENDLTALSYLHEPAVLHNLRVRFVESKIIYTYCGIILVAVNPYKQLPIYGDAVIHAYSGQNMGDLDPHIFAVAEEAYKQMARNNRNQSIIVSGESGAGKTVSARYAMRYFAVVSKSSSKTRVEDKVLASNPITEAIGNAKTTRNDNSSRFGKYTEISFDQRHQIIGANMRTYLLEKSRVVFQSENERNYHIFYQLCACADQPDFKHLRLLSADQFQYTCLGGATEIDGVDDRADMAETRRTFTLLGLKEDFLSDVFKVLAAILHLGNVTIKTTSGEKSAVSTSDVHLAVFCELVCVDVDSVCRWLCHRRLVLLAETVVKPVPMERAVNARDALAKHIYAHLFDCVIHRINTALKVPGKQHSFIGVLDIYGFETFDVNSFEQFCINYANEKLQHQFNLHVFKLEQEEYMKEDIPWTLIDFYDNQPVIDLIEAKMGILDLLDEECLFPQGTDLNWLQKLYNFLGSNPLFSKPRLSNQAFVIQHFADQVEYQCKGFLEKNRDTLYEELVDIMKASKFSLLADFFREESQTAVRGVRVKAATPAVKPANKQLRTTVGNKFRSSLYLLMETLNATTPHYVRCIKPNEDKQPFEYDSKRVVQQLRACGVLETVHISAQSYPSRWTYIEFYSRYSILMTQAEVVLNDKKQTCKSVLQRLIPEVQVHLRSSHRKEVQVHLRSSHRKEVQVHLRSSHRKEVQVHLRSSHRKEVQVHLRSSHRKEVQVHLRSSHRKEVQVHLRSSHRKEVQKEEVQVHLRSSHRKEVQVHLRSSHRKEVQVHLRSSHRKEVQVHLRSSHRKEVQVHLRSSHRKEVQVHLRSSHRKEVQVHLRSSHRKEVQVHLRSSHRKEVQVHLRSSHRKEVQVHLRSSHRKEVQVHLRSSHRKEVQVHLRSSHRKEVQVHLRSSHRKEVQVHLRSSHRKEVQVHLRSSHRKEVQVHLRSSHRKEVQVHLRSSHRKEVQVHLRSSHRKEVQVHLRSSHAAQEETRGAGFHAAHYERRCRYTLQRPQKEVQVRLHVLTQKGGAGTPPCAPTERRCRYTSTLKQKGGAGTPPRAHHRKEVQVHLHTLKQKGGAGTPPRAPQKGGAGTPPRAQTERRCRYTSTRSHRKEVQGKENRGLMERLTGLANAHSQGLDKLQALEAELSKSANNRMSLEKQEKRNKEAANQMITQLQTQKAALEAEKKTMEAKMAESAQQMRDNFSELQKRLQEDLEKEERRRKIAENNLENQKEDSGREVEVLQLENRQLREEKLRLQMQLEEEKHQIAELQEQITQLTKHIKVLPELRKDIHNLQSQKTEQERRAREQTHQAKVKMNVIIRQLLGDRSSEDILSAASDDAEEDGNLLLAFDGLQKATRVMETQLRDQREGFESQVEVLSFKMEHLQKENEQLQNLFQEKSDVNESIRQEVARLTAENMVIPELKQQVGELLRQKQDLETQQQEETSQMMGRIEQVSTRLQTDLQEESSRCRQFEQQLEEVQRRLEEQQEQQEQLLKQQQAEQEAKSRLRQETSRLTADNMGLEEQLDMKDRLIKKLQDQIRSLKAPDKANQKATPAVPREYLGMLEYRREDEPKIIQNLILDLRPRGVVVNMFPGLAAHLLFMCVRHADYLNDGAKLKSLMHGIITGLKKVIMEHQEDFEALSFWLSNTCHLLNCLKQYSGEEEFMKHNTPRQNKNCLTNFDLSEHRQIFSDLAIRIYHKFIAAMETMVTPLIVPAMLEHESLQGISSMKPSGLRKRSNSVYEEAAEACSMASILQLLSGFHASMLQHGMDSELVKQAVRQLFYLLGATCLNTILLRKDMCSCRKGMQIRCNISYLEEWLKEKDLQGSSAMETLRPLSQAAWLLQVNKTSDEDAREIRDSCPELSPVQIVKILNSYTPIDDFEKRVASSFVRKVQALLQEREGSSQLMVDTQYRFQVTFPFCASAQALELLQVPSSLRLSFLTRI
ncbi:unconventional myosin-Vc [Alosa alosa]|uniref:unconventional myosin-Vc n=1 Tax=Alosa alosa TaxID=278164 RepID=UPI002015048B|nr:unconventional myosin-Vc [Alosa alosa]